MSAAPSIASKPELPAARSIPWISVLSSIHEALLKKGDFFGLLVQLVIVKKSLPGDGRQRASVSISRKATFDLYKIMHL